MLRKTISLLTEPLAFVIFFYLSIRRIIWGSPVFLQEHTFEKTFPDIVLWLLLLLLFIWVANSKSYLRNMISKIKWNWVLLTFILFAFFSITWSSNYSASIYKVIVLFGCSAIALYTGLNHGENFLYRGFWWFSVIVALFTFAVAYLIPSMGTEIGYPNYGAWRGIFWSKNYMGSIMVFINLVFLFNIASSGKKIVPLVGNTVFYFLTAILIILSKSATAIILIVLLNLCFLLAVAWVKLKKHLYMVHYVIMTIAFIIILIIIIQNLDFLFGLLNRNTSLTGRIPLWSFLIQTGWANHPLLGNGFGATWDSNNFRFSTQATVGWTFPVIMSDNGYIDIFLHLGLVGVFLLFSTVTLAFFRSVKYALKEQTINSFFPFLLVIFVITVNISLSYMLELESFAWFLLVFALFATTPIPLEKRLRGNQEI